jgi:hypothetical protein
MTPTLRRAKACAYFHVIDLSPASGGPNDGLSDPDSKLTAGDTTRTVS